MCRCSGLSWHIVWINSKSNLTWLSHSRISCRNINGIATEEKLVKPNLSFHKLIQKDSLFKCTTNPSSIAITNNCKRYFHIWIQNLLHSFWRSSINVKYKLKKSMFLAEEKVLSATFRNYKQKINFTISFKTLKSSQNWTCVHKAKNKEISRWASDSDMVDTLWTTNCALFVVLVSPFPVSETWEPLTDVSWLPTWKNPQRKKDRWSK